MRLLITISCLNIFLLSCQEQSPEAKVKSFIDSMETAKKVDSAVDATLKNAMFDTVGVSKAPIKVVNAKLVKEDYSSYRDIQLTFKNVSDKVVSAVRFSWYGENAFGEPADMGSYVIEGFGGGFTDKTLRPGKSLTLEWSILSRDGKKVIAAWPTEVAFEDGTKWELDK